MRPSILALAAFTLGAPIACGLDNAGIVDQTLSPDGAIAIDGSIDSDIDGPGGDGGDSSAAKDAPSADAPFDTAFDAADAAGCTDVVPGGWARVGLDVNGTVTCASGFSALNVIESPTAVAGACGCSCTADTPPTCTSIATGSDGTTCGTARPTLTTSASCSAQAYSMSSRFRGIVTPTGAPTCTSVLSPDRTKVSSASERTCTPGSPAAEDELCTRAAAMGLRDCIQMLGNQICPGPFTQKHVVGTDFALACPACGPCTPGGTCSSVTVQLFTDGSCGNSPGDSILADTTCRAATVKNYGSYKTGLSTPTPACTAASDTTPPLPLTNEETVCCKP